ncbi:uncharacterized protein LOC113656882 [Tachysurus fulvidraco]|uniref:uncharacterized protein LOC113656882 n=1 Tax=Tachysurus fulvidraco TaxID=1234273 RepID=UPI001FF01FF3|nr:uncharacterized protein LOC113656882 [Tachysurus fulvidraco]
MEKWLQRQRLSVFFFITFFFPACGDVLYLNTTNASSIQFSCVFDLYEEHKPFAFTLRREWIQAQDVLYHNFATDADVKDSTFVGRIGDRLVNKAVDVNITDLQGFDTDRYICVFHYQTTAGFHNQSGRDKIVLYVKDVSLGDMIYLHKTNGSSIQFSCVFDPYEKQAPFAFTLRREWIQAQDVLYHNFTTDADVKDSTFVGRIGDRLGDNTVDVSITDLQGFDTDLYVCVFHYQTTAGFHIQSVRHKIVLYVKDVFPCTSYTPLLFALSAGVGLLFFIVIISVVHLMKPCSRGQMKPQNPVPIYEEMNGVREKPSSRLQEDDVSSLYCKPRKENPYIN